MATEAPLADVATAPSAPPIAPRLPDAERYALLEELGRGGMGVVYAAYDTQLDRKVALKLVADQLLGSAHQDRLRREARALAQLSHPNVVPVFDVGELAGRVYFTMEFVRGRTASAWARDARTIDEILALGRAAAAGLAAAHAIGLIHRDVKPSNILVGDDGRVRVADFGVAREAIAAGGDVGTPVMTAAAGSPAYMAPEQLRGAPLDARCDQFALCVTLYELLHGQRPFAADGRVAQLAAIDAGPPPPVRVVPAWVAAAIARGLAAAPEARHRDMAALAAALSPPRRRRAGWYAAAAAALAGSAVLALRLASPAPVERPRCDLLGAPIAQTWAPPRRAALLARLGGDASAAHLAAQIDEYAARWRVRRASACEAARIDRSWSVELEARAERCLEQRRASLDAMLVAVIERGAAPSVERARDAFAQLGTPLPCGDPDYLRSTIDVATPTPQRAAQRALDDELAALELDSSLGRDANVARALPALRTRLRALDHQAGLARAALLEGNLAKRTDLAAAVRLHAAAYSAARAARAPIESTKAAVALMWDLGMQGDERSRARDWAQIATAEASLLDDRDVGAIVHYALGALADRGGETARALDEFERAVAIARREYGDGHAVTAKVSAARAGVLTALGRPAEALGAHREAVAQFERWAGATSVALAPLLGNLALTEIDVGELAEAEVHARRALALAETGTSREILATSLHNVGSVAFARAQHGEAAAWFARAAEAFEAGQISGAAAASRVWHAIAFASDAAARRDAATLARLRAEIVAARATLVASFGDDDPAIAIADLGLGAVLARQGDCAAAAPWFARGDAMQARVHADDSQRATAKSLRALCPGR